MYFCIFTPSLTREVSDEWKEKYCKGKESMKLKARNRGYYLHPDVQKMIDAALKSRTTRDDEKAPIDIREDLTYQTIKETIAGVRRRWNKRVPALLEAWEERKARLMDRLKNNKLKVSRPQLKELLGVKPQLYPAKSVAMYASRFLGDHGWQQKTQGMKCKIHNTQ